MAGLYDGGMTVGAARMEIWSFWERWAPNAMVAHYSQ